MNECCRHRQTWFIADGRLEWCWRCGALREISRTLGDCVAMPWVKPTATGTNPYTAWRNRCEAVAERSRSGEGAT